MEQPGNDIAFHFSQGDSGAFTAIYNEYYPTLYYFVKRFVYERVDAEDITADIFVKLWKMHPNFATIQNIKAFLYITARNSCIDFLRRRQRQTERQKEMLYVLLQQPAEGILKDDTRAEVLRMIYQEIELLPPARRNVFKLAYLDGLSNDAIADFLHLSNQTVRNHKQLAVNQLRMAILQKNILVAALLYLYLPDHATLQ